MSTKHKWMIGSALAALFVAKVGYDMVFWKWNDRLALLEDQAEELGWPVDELAMSAGGYSTFGLCGMRTYAVWTDGTKGGEAQDYELHIARATPFTGWYCERAQVRP